MRTNAVFLKILYHNIVQLSTPFEKIPTKAVVDLFVETGDHDGLFCTESTHRRVRELKGSAGLRSFNAMLANEAMYIDITIQVKSIAEYPKELSFFCNE